MEAEVGVDTFHDGVETQMVETVLTHMETQLEQLETLMVHMETQMVEASLVPTPTVAHTPWEEEAQPREHLRLEGHRLQDPRQRRNQQEEKEKCCNLREP